MDYAFSLLPLATLIRPLRLFRLLRLRLLIHANDASCHVAAHRRHADIFFCHFAFFRAVHTSPCLLMLLSRLRQRCRYFLLAFSILLRYAIFAL